MTKTIKVKEAKFRVILRSNKSTPGVESFKMHMSYQVPLVKIAELVTYLEQFHLPRKKK